MQERRSWIKRVWRALGPGFITGAADDDPSGIATYSQTGAGFGFSQLWTVLFAYPFMVTMQEMSGRIGMVTGMGLSGIIKKHYSRHVLRIAVSVLFFANVVNIGADLGAMAASAQLLFDVPFFVLLLGITVFVVLLEILVPYPTYAKFLKYLALSLLAYVATAFIIKQDWGHIAYSALIPHPVFTKGYLLNIAAILGTTISPYLFFWQADQEVEEEIVHHKVRAMGKGVPKISISDITIMRFDTAIGMLFSQIVTFFIIVTVASTLGAKGIHTIDTAAQAASALKPVAGNFAFLLFTLGIFGTGLLAVPVLAGSAAYAVAEALGWRASLGARFRQAHGFYGIIIVAMLVGLLVNFTSIGAMRMLYYAAVLNGLLAPPLMVLILLIGNNKKILGAYTNSRRSNILGWIIAGVMGAVSIALLISFL
ncbi:MAG: divalent metal cation transporter [Candidatus Azambacteria bacterium]|nr:divalent metal cation transporter [Candidatus Azambacteria bacterium]